jgi:protein TonB
VQKPESKPADEAPSAEPATPTTAVAAEASSAPERAARAAVPAAIPGQNPSPDYPAAAWRRGIEGTVLVRFTLTADGSVASCIVLASSGCIALDDAALAAARRWRFSRGPGDVEVPFVFSLRDRA